MRTALTITAGLLGALAACAPFSKQLKPRNSSAPTSIDITNASCGWRIPPWENNQLVVDRVQTELLLRGTWPNFAAMCFQGIGQCTQ